MKRVANKSCRPYVERREEFQGSNLYGTWIDHRRRYVVYSWGGHWPLYVWDEGAKQWFGNETHHTQSTNRHSSQAQPYDAEITWCSLRDIRDVEFHGVERVVRRKITEAVQVAA